jgi:Xaa-Pro aminopeptidase
VDSLNPVYAGDVELSRLLAAAGLAWTPSEIRSLIAGVNAAPDGSQPDRWLALVGENLPDALTGQLQALRRLCRRPEGAEGTVSSRIAALRAELKRQNLDGFVIPRGDEHQGEYVPARAQRLAWATGFTGSAGLAIVLLDRAIIFVDGRYTIQVQQEVPGDLFSSLHLVDDDHAAWAAANLRPGARLGFDPWLHTVGWVEKMQSALSRSGAELVSLEGNPVDAAWPDQPPPPLGLVSVQPLRFAGRSAEDKRSDIGRILQDAGAAATVITQPDSIAWLLNVRGSDVPCTPLPLSFAIAHAGGDVDWFVDRRKLAPELDAHLGNRVSVRPPGELGEALDRLGAAGAKVRVDPAWSAAWVADRLRAAGATLESGSDPCIMPKACKNQTEIEGTRAAHIRDGGAMVRFLSWLDREAPGGGLTEIDAVDQLLNCRRQVPLFRDLSFDTISGAGPNGAIVHYRVSPQSNRPITPGQLFLIDSGGQYQDGTTDITRTVIVGEPTSEMQRNFTLVLKGHIALSACVFPKGTTGSQLDVLARQALWQHGLDYDHGTGHGVGSFLSVHEGPQRIAKMPNSIALQPGMILSNEPGYYKTGAYGIRIENLILVQPAAIADAERPMYRFETLTFCPIDRRLVAPDLLSSSERDWLNAYHGDVFRKLSPGLSGAELDWLQQATVPV